VKASTPATSPDQRRWHAKRVFILPKQHAAEREARRAVIQSRIVGRPSQYVSPVMPAQKIRPPRALEARRLEVPESYAKELPTTICGPPVIYGPRESGNFEVFRSVRCAACFLSLDGNPSSRSSTTAPTRARAGIAVIDADVPAASSIFLFTARQGLTITARDDGISGARGRQESVFFSLGHAARMIKAAARVSSSVLEKPTDKPSCSRAEGEHASAYPYGCAARTNT